MKNRRHENQAAKRAGDLARAAASASADSLRASARTKRKPSSRALLSGKRAGQHSKSGSLTPLRDATDLGRAVQAIRKKRGLSQQNFADLAGVGRRFLSELEQGKPTLEISKVLKVARAAGIDILMAAR